MQIELKNCPCCNTAPKLHTNAETTRSIKVNIFCPKCQISMNRTFGYDIDELLGDLIDLVNATVDEWNTRKYQS